MKKTKQHTRTMIQNKRFPWREQQCFLTRTKLRTVGIPSSEQRGSGWASRDHQRAGPKAGTQSGKCDCHPEGHTQLESLANLRVQVLSGLGTK